MTNRFFATLAVAGLISAAACNTGDEVRIEDPAVAPTTEEPVMTPAPTTDPMVTDPATTDPMVDDTLMYDDTTVPPTEGTATPQTPPTNP